MLACPRCGSERVFEGTCLDCGAEHAEEAMAVEAFRADHVIPFEPPVAMRKGGEAAAPAALEQRTALGIPWTATGGRGPGTAREATRPSPDADGA